MSVSERSDEERLRVLEAEHAAHLCRDRADELVECWLLSRVRALEAELREDRETRQALVLDEEAAALRAERDRERNEAAEALIEKQNVIAALRAERDRLREALIAQAWSGGDGEHPIHFAESCPELCPEYCQIARAALQGGERS